MAAAIFETIQLGHAAAGGGEHTYRGRVSAGAGGAALPLSEEIRESLALAPLVALVALCGLDVGRGTLEPSTQRHVDGVERRREA